MSAQLSYVDQVLTISGELSFSTVQRLQQQLKNDLLGATDTVLVDLSAVTKADTASLALCLSIERLVAKKATVSYQHVPQAILAIAESVGIAELFSKAN